MGLKEQSWSATPKSGEEPESSVARRSGLDVVVYSVFPVITSFCQKRSEKYIEP